MLVARPKRNTVHRRHVILNKTIPFNFASPRLLLLFSAFILFVSYDVRGFTRSNQRQRARTAQKLGNPRLKQITFHTLRHWKAAMEYHKTKDTLYVICLLGHKNVKNTLFYTQLVIFEDDGYVCKATTNVKEARVNRDRIRTHMRHGTRQAVQKAQIADRGCMLKSRGWELNPYRAALQAAASTVQPPRQL